MKKKQILLSCAVAVFLCSVVSLKADVTGKIVFSDVAVQKLYVMNIDGTPVNVNHLGVSYNQFPHWSPDGQWITFQGNQADGGNAQIWVIQPGGSGLRRVTDGSGQLTSPSFSPGGTKILYSQLYGDLYTINLDGSDNQPLGASGGHAEWSPDGTKISYTRYGYGGNYDSDIFTYDLASKTEKNLTVDFHILYQGFAHATWSPDGTTLALGGFKYDGNWDVFRININADGTGTGFVNLTEELTSTNENWPHWSLDGQNILFDRNVGGVQDIWAMGIDGSSPLPLGIANNMIPEQGISYFDIVPEPATLFLLTLGGLALRRRK
jgi:Tol biopolymer transport system component